MTLPYNRPADTTDAHATARFHMVQQQIRPWVVQDVRVLDALEQVRREDFVPPANYEQAFMDVEIPLGVGEQIMLAPKVDARMANDLAIQPHERVLEIGTGTGYSAALLGRLAKEVLTLEINPELAELARENLQSAGADNVSVRVGDGAKDALAEGPFDVIVLSGSVEVLPESLLNHLKDGGRLGAIVGQEPMMRFTLVKRQGNERITTTPWDTVAPRLSGFARAERFVF
ncbi:protein-L-isoaspartate O-methyltransferase [Comamonas sp. GB3 AK4-5]|uniref:protein-L-isoaspartate O-methyltransferase family protein n=1 Tax=Comamonas sp. GB3 AK4-5 TaxID=3231487 RepID=UPI00351DDE98